jgi:hypothetical protein
MGKLYSHEKQDWYRSEVAKDFYITVHIDGIWRVWIASKLINLACWVLVQITRKKMKNY